MAELLDASRLLPPDQFQNGIVRAVELLGGTDARVLLADFEQRRLLPVDPGPSFGVDDSPAGQAFRTSTTVTEADRTWLPLRFGTERLGVLEVVLPTVPEPDLTEWDLLARLVAQLVGISARSTDIVFETRRRERMALAAEMQWRLLPPLSLCLPQLDVAGMLEPAYAVGGDAFDFAYDDGVLHLAVFDAMGHGVQSALTSTLTVAAYRHARRQGFAFSETFTTIDRVLVDHRPSSFSTGVLAELEAATGMFRWINAGHPAPWLLREGTAVPLDVVPSLPFGLSDLLSLPEVPPTGNVQLRPGDRVVLISDGILDNGDVTAAAVATLAVEEGVGHDVSETVRHLTHRALALADGDLLDDATIVLVEYRGAQSSGSTQAR